MSIYDEALEEIKKLWNGNELTYPKHTIKALKRAKKEHELLGLYQEREKSRVTVDGFLKSWELTKQIQALEGEL